MRTVHSMGGPLEPGPVRLRRYGRASSVAVAPATISAVKSARHFFTIAIAIHTARKIANTKVT